jgi:hypothetical protein
MGFIFLKFASEFLPEGEPPLVRKLDAEPSRRAESAEPEKGNSGTVKRSQERRTGL